MIDRIPTLLYIARVNENTIGQNIYCVYGGKPAFLFTLFGILNCHAFSRFNVTWTVIVKSRTYGTRLWRV